METRASDPWFEGLIPGFVERISEPQFLHLSAKWEQSRFLLVWVNRCNKTTVRALSMLDA